MKSHETAFHVINCHVPVCHAVVPSRKWTMWLFRYVIVISYKCSITSTEVAPSISLSLLEKEWRDFIFHFSLLEKSESYPYFTLFSREKRVKSGAGYNLTSIFVPNCISKNCQISSKHQPQNIGQISISKSWLNPVLHVWTKLQLKKVTKNSALISWPNFSFSTKLSLIRSSSTLTSFQLAFLHTRVTSVKFGTERQTRQCNDRTWIW